jgi:hypothetical protein
MTPLSMKNFGYTRRFEGFLDWSIGAYLEYLMALEWSFELEHPRNSGEELGRLEINGSYTSATG